MDQRHRRTWIVTWTVFGVFILSAGQFLQSWQGVAKFANLSSLPLSVQTWYFVVGGAVWGIAWLTAGVGLWRMQEWARRFALVLIPLSLAAWLADQWIFSRSPVFDESIGFNFVIRLIPAAAAFLALRGSASRFSRTADTNTKADTTG